MSPTARKTDESPQRQLDAVQRSTANDLPIRSGAFVMSRYLAVMLMEAIERVRFAASRPNVMSSESDD